MTYCLSPLTHVNRPDAGARTQIQDLLDVGRNGGQVQLSADAEGDGVMAEV